MARDDRAAAPTTKARRKRGRPKGAKNRKTLVREVAHEAHRIPEGNKVVRRTTVELVAMVVRNKAVRGDTPAIRALEKLYGILGAHHHTDYPVGLVLPAPSPPDVWARDLKEYTDMMERKHNQKPSNEAS